MQIFVGMSAATLANRNTIRIEHSFDIKRNVTIAMNWSYVSILTGDVRQLNELAIVYGWGVVLRQD